MSKTFEDRTGAKVTVALNESTQAYEVSLADGTVAGSAFFLPGSGGDDERIFHHTVVDKEFGGRGLATILVAEALEDSRARGVTVVPVCSLFVKKLAETGDDYLAQGGLFRKATGADIDIVKRQA